jgi:hypothetical protein
MYVILQFTWTKIRSRFIKQDIYLHIVVDIVVDMVVDKRATNYVQYNYLVNLVAYIKIDINKKLKLNNKHKIHLNIINNNTIINNTKEWI